MRYVYYRIIPQLFLRLHFPDDYRLVKELEYQYYMWLNIARVGLGHYTPVNRLRMRDVTHPPDDTPGEPND